MKNKHLFLFILFLFVVNQSNIYSQTANNTDPVLFSFGNINVPKSEFLYVYEKHNANDSAKYSQKSVDEYLSLYSNFKLKVKEAEELGYDTTENIKSQIDNYRKQLAQSYLYNKEITEKLIEEAYKRMQTEINVSHILFMCAEDASPSDTLATYKNALAVRDRLVTKKEDFTKLAKEFSQDPSVKDNNGNIGYISAFQTVYPFESAAYNTKIGTISLPIRSKYGYHLVKPVDSRTASGKVQVAHILVKTSENDDPKLKKAAEDTIKMIYNKLLSKLDFAELAQKYSADKSSAAKGGVLKFIASGETYPEFEEVAFKLKNKDDFSKPFKTKLGWEIIKLIEKKPVPSYEEAKADLKAKIEKDSRSWYSKKEFAHKLKKEYNLKENANAKKELTSKIDTSILKGRWTIDKAENLNATIATITLPNNQKQEYTQQEFAEFIQNNQLKARTSNLSASTELLYNMWIEQNLLDAKESMLEIEQPEFAKLMKEFRDGTLLFELTEKKVWNKAIEDTIGLKSYYEKVKNKYKWNERANVTIFTCNNSQTADKVREMLIKMKKKVDTNKITSKINNTKDKTPLVTISNGIFEKEQNPLLQKIEWQKGLISPNLGNETTNVSIVKINDILAPTTKKLDEARGYIVADYQSYLEQNWLEELKNKYKIRINNSVLQTIYK